MSPEEEVLRLKARVFELENPPPKCPVCRHGPHVGHTPRPVPAQDKSGRARRVGWNTCPNTCATPGGWGDTLCDCGHWWNGHYQQSERCGVAGCGCLGT